MKVAPVTYGVSGRTRAITLALTLLATSIIGLGPANAATCMPPGGDDLPFSGAGDDGAALVINGGGWGHGVGMSQYGAQGAALSGCSEAEILATYYPGTDIAAPSTPRETIAVHLRRLTSGSTRLAVSSGGAAVPWQACDLSGDSCSTVATQSPGATWKVTGLDDGTFVLSATGVDPTGCPSGSGQASGCHWRGGTMETRLRAQHDTTVVTIVEMSRKVRWGWVEFDHTSANNGQTFVTQHVTGGQGVTAIDRYLRGLAEMPSSWEPAALRAQAIAGRSYAEATIRGREGVYGRHPQGGWINRSDCRCDLFATTMDQVYKGWDHESPNPRWRDAVDATAGQVVTFNGKAVAAFYSSSHGGFSEAVRDVWGTALPYLQAVDTSRWEQNTTNSRQRWTKSFTAAEAASAFGFSSFTSLEINATGAGGRPTAANGGGALATGLNSAGNVVTKRYSGEQLRSLLGLFSAQIRVAGATAPPEPDPTPEPTSDPTPEPAATAAGEGEPAPAPAIDPAWERIAGDDDLDTAIQLSRAGWDTATHVVLTRDDDAADALAGSALAGFLGAPLMMTPKGSLDARVGDEITRLGAGTVVVLGGHAAVSSKVADGIRATGATVDRIGGADRYETAVMISERLPSDPGGAVLLVRGNLNGATAWADALAVSAVAAARARDGFTRPVLIASSGLPGVTAERIKALKPSKVALIGGTAVLPHSVDDAIVGLDIGLTRDDLVRYAGEDRWGTSRALASLSIGDAKRLVIASGKQFQNGLAAGPYAAKVAGRMLLVPDDVDGSSPWGDGEHLDLVRDLGWTDADLDVVGVAGTVGDDVAAAIQDALG